MRDKLTEWKERIFLRRSHLNWGSGTWALGLMIHKTYISLWLGQHEFSLVFVVMSRDQWLMYKYDEWMVDDDSYLTTERMLHPPEAM